MGFKNYRDASRTNWGTPDEGLTLEQINTGAILRIADATEKMAQRHTDLIDSRDYWERRAKRAENALETERRRNAALRGHMKRAKNAANAIELRGEPRSGESSDRRERC